MLATACQRDGKPDAGPSAGASPTTADQQFLPFVEAIGRYLASRNPQAPAFQGDCESTTPGPEPVLCSAPVGEFEGKEVHGIGRPASEVETYLLLERRDNGWRVVDAHSVDVATPGTTPANLPPWLKAALATP
jgi:hypothetical protein